MGHFGTILGHSVALFGHLEVVLRLFGGPSEVLGRPIGGSLDAFPGLLGQLRGRSWSFSQREREREITGFQSFYHVHDRVNMLVFTCQS